MGFHIGSALLQFEATGEGEFLELERSKTLRYMAPMSRMWACTIMALTTFPPMAPSDA